ncbi:MAG TPA: hypothetical protein VF541_07350 [Longimicrobium sp.]|jgi:hypothetical protein
MAMFVHLAPEKLAPAIRRGGLRPLRVRGRSARGVYAVPVTPNFVRTHQWLRELKRRGDRTLVGVYFRVPDDTPVTVGHYGHGPRVMTAAEAVRLFMGADDVLGWEVIFAEAVKPAQIHAVRRLPNLVGWRYRPGAHQTRPCGCEGCQRGQYGARRLRREYEEWLNDR